MNSTERIVPERILCPVDLTPGSDEALRYAIALANAYGSTLFIAHCARKASSIERDRLAKLLEVCFRKHLRLPGPQPIEHRSLVIDGEPETALAEEAARLHIDLIVMRSTRRKNHATFMGSVAENVVKSAPCPVLVTHPGEKEWAGKSTNDIEIARVLIAYDLSSESELALSWGMSLAQEYQAEIHLLHVLPTRERVEAAELALLPISARVGFDVIRNRLSTAVPVDVGEWCRITNVIREGLPYREVLAYAEEADIDLICMGSAGTGFGIRSLFGSNADRVLRQAPCPVLVARPLRPIP